MREKERGRDARAVDQRSTGGNERRETGQEQERESEGDREMAEASVSDCRRTRDCVRSSEEASLAAAGRREAGDDAERARRWRRWREEGERGKEREKERGSENRICLLPPSSLSPDFYAVVLSSSLSLPLACRRPSSSSSSMLLDWAHHSRSLSEGRRRGGRRVRNQITRLGHPIMRE